MEFASSDEYSASVDRKVLQTGGNADAGWINYPERAFDDECGAIKIGPTVQGKDSYFLKNHSKYKCLFQTKEMFFLTRSFVLRF